MKTVDDIQTAWLLAMSQQASDDSLAEFSDLFENKNIHPTLGLSVYQDSLRASLLNHLQDAYQVCQQLVGETFWVALCHRYINSHPSKYNSIADYGADLDKFLVTFPPTQQLGYLADIARIDWAWHYCFYAPDCHPFDAKAFAALAEEDMLASQLIINPSLTMIKSPYPVFTIWQSNYNKLDQQISLQNNAEQCIVWRKGLVAHIEVCDEKELHWLELIQNKHCWYTICEQMTTRIDVTDLPRLLSKSIEKQWISNFTTTNQPDN